MMIRVTYVERSDHEHYVRVNQTLLTGRYFEETGTLKYRLHEVVDNADALRETHARWSYEPYDLILAYVDGQLAGYCVYITDKAGVELYVCPRYRRKGVASALVKEVRKYTKLAVLHAKPGFPGSSEFFERNHIFVEGTRAVYGVMRELGGEDYGYLPSDEFVRLYKRATKTLKLRLHHRLRKANANC